MSKLIYEENSYRINGLLFEIYNELGYGHRERTYQQAFAQQLLEAKLPFRREVYLPVYFREKLVSKYFLDFLIDDKIIVEIKVANDFYQSDVGQILAYLKEKNCRLGILTLFTESGVRIKRIVN